ncbi:MAG: HTTM domain-containing protein [Pirellulales bacterium]
MNSSLSHTTIVERFVARSHRFLFESCDPTVIPLLRIGLGSLLMIVAATWLRDAELWFTDAGVLRSDTVDKLSRFPHWSLLSLLPSTALVAQICLVMMFVQAAMLTIGFYGRFQAACLFLWLVSFQHRNPLLCDGEDTLFRLLAFSFVFLPLDARMSIRSRLAGFCRSMRSASRVIGPADCWALRLVQFQMAVIYASATWNKLQGSSWHDGSAMLLVTQMTDHYGRMGLPAFIVENVLLMKMLTWSVLVIEGFLPIGLWFRSTRRIALLLGIALHLGIEWTMHLFLFEWVMILGLLSFARAEDNLFAAVYRRLSQNQSCAVGSDLKNSSITPATFSRPDSDGCVPSGPKSSAV